MSRIKSSIASATTYRWRYLPFAFLLLVQTSFGREVRVDSIEGFHDAIADAAPGDRIVVRDGTYVNTAPLKVAAGGTKDKPIEIVAQTVGGVEIKGRTGFAIESPAAYVVLRGFKFTHDAGTVKLSDGTHHCRVTRNVFALRVARSASYMTVSGDDHEIDHNTFQDKNTEGKMLEIVGPGSSAMAQRAWIHHNYFFNFANANRNNASALHIGSSARSLSPAHCIVEYNLFVKTRGENEGAICNKACDNIYRFNTFGEGCTELSLRHGNRCLVYGNFFLGTRGGLRFFGDDHRIFSNYFERNRPAVQIGNGDGNVPPAKLTSHDRPDRVQFVFNTLVNNMSNVVMDRRKNGLGASHLVFANNIIQGGDRGVSIGGPLEEPKWKGNICWKTDAGDIPATGYMSVDPKLELAPDHRFQLRAGSPAIRRANGAYSDFELEIDGQKRGALLDVGADQLSSVPILNKILTLEDVGPFAN
jgi:poly(beta-D-mannuronate) lyase